MHNGMRIPKPIEAGSVDYYVHDGEPESQRAYTLLPSYIPQLIPKCQSLGT